MTTKINITPPVLNMEKVYPVISILYRVYVLRDIKQLSEHIDKYMDAFKSPGQFIHSMKLVAQKSKPGNPVRNAWGEELTTELMTKHKNNEHLSKKTIMDYEPEDPNFKREHPILSCVYHSLVLGRTEHIRNNTSEFVLEFEAPDELIDIIADISIGDTVDEDKAAQLAHKIVHNFKTHPVVW